MLLRKLVMVLLIGGGLVVGTAAEASAERPDRCIEAFSETPPPTNGDAYIAITALWFNCQRGQWVVAPLTDLTWYADTISSLYVYLSTDGNSASGCGGDDYIIVVDENTSSVFRTPSCDPNTWRRTGAVTTFRVADPDDWAGAIFDAGAIGGVDRHLSARVVLSDYGARFSMSRSITGTTVTANGTRQAPPEPPPGSNGFAFWSGFCEIPFDNRIAGRSISRLYRAYFVREPDASGHAYWLSRYSNGDLCLTDISEYFSRSTEFVSTYGSLDNPNFVRRVYLNVLGREPDPEGYQFWADALNRGLLRGTMMVGFSESPEFRSRTQIP